MDTDTLKRLITDAEQGKSELPDDILNFEGGLSSPRVRRLLNALCAQPEARYLEIGVHTGSTFIAAVYGNTAPATCIDQWQMFDHAQEQFERNVKRLIPSRAFTQIDGDCFSVELNGLRGVNVFFYDGAHDRTSQYDAIKHYADRLARRCVLLVDDANWEEPREETRRAVRDLGWRVLYDVLLPGDYNGSAAGWWNGLLVMLVEKS